MSFIVSPRPGCLKKSPTRGHLRCRRWWWSKNINKGQTLTVLWYEIQIIPLMPYIPTVLVIALQSQFLVQLVTTNAENKKKAKDKWLLLEGHVVALSWTTQWVLLSLAVQFFHFQVYNQWHQHCNFPHGFDMVQVGLNVN